MRIAAIFVLSIVGLGVIAPVVFSRETIVMQARIVKRVSVGRGPYALVANPNTNRIYVANHDDSSISVIDEDTLSVVNRIVTRSGPGYHAPNMDLANNRIFFPNNADLSVSVIDGNDDSLRTIKGMIGNPETVLYNAATDELYVSNGGAYITIIELSTGNVVTKGMHSENYNHHLAFNSRTNHLYVSRTDPNRITVLQLPARTRWSRDILATGVMAIDESLDRLYAAEFNGRWLYVLNGSTGEEIRRVAVGNGGHSVAINHSTGCVYVGATDRSLYIYDGDKQTLVGSIALGFPVDEVAVNPNSGLVYLTHSESNQVSIVEDKTCSERAPEPTSTATELRNPSATVTNTPTVIEPTPTLATMAIPATPSVFRTPTRIATQTETPDIFGTSVAATLTALVPTPSSTRTASSTPTPLSTLDLLGTAVAATLTALAPPSSDSGITWLPYLGRQHVLNLFTPTPAPTPIVCVTSEREPNNDIGQALGQPILCPSQPIRGALSVADDPDDPGESDDKSGDYFTVLIDRPLTARIRLDPSDIQAPVEYDLSVYRCQPEQCLEVGYSGKTGKKIDEVVAGLEPGTYFVGVRPRTADRSDESYILGWEILP